MCQSSGTNKPRRTSPDNAFFDMSKDAMTPLSSSTNRMTGSASSSSSVSGNEALAHCERRTSSIHMTENFFISCGSENSLQELSAYNRGRGRIDVQDHFPLQGSIFAQRPLEEHNTVRLQHNTTDGLSGGSDKR